MQGFPDFERAWEYENGFYLTCDITRMAKMLAHYELFKWTLDVPGDIVECGVFKGASFSRFAMYRRLMTNAFSRHLIGFDAYGPFPTTEHEDDQPYLQRFIDAAGDESITMEQMQSALDHKGCGEAVTMVKGNICQTVPEYVEKNPHQKIALLNLDTDVYEPAKTILEYLYPRIVPGGILVLDDYGTFPGETQAVDEYFAEKDVRIQRLSFARTPSYIIKPKI